MRFIASSHNYEKVVVPRRKVFLPNGEHGGVSGGLHARFVNHTFDSLVAQQTHGWSDEDRQSVEQALLNMPGFGTAGTGVYLDEQLPAGQEGGEHEAVVPAKAETAVAAPALRCIYTVQTPEGSEQCSREARKNGDLCNQHYKLTMSEKAEAKSA